MNKENKGKSIKTASLSRTYFSFFVFAYFLFHLGRVRDAKKYEDFDPELKKVALGTFVLSILFWLSLYL